MAATTAVASLGLGGTWGRADAASSTFTTPVYAGDFPDPSLLLSENTYWAYSTGSGGRNLQVMRSPDMRTWSNPVDPLPTLPAWAGAGRTWAPGVMKIGDVYVMYYTVRDTALSTQCISLATSTTPGGPFVDKSSGPLICQTAHGGSIDPNPYRDPVSGGLFLVWKSDDNSIGQRTHLWGQPLSADGLSLSAGTAPTLLLTQSARWQSPAVEGPTVVRAGGVYYLFYGANSYNSANSGIGYATSRSLLGAYTDQSRYRPWLATTGRAVGPQGPMVFTDGAGANRMAFAAWYGAAGYQNGGMRALWIGTLGFDRRGTPALS
ncbi:MAG TPA: glycoside hydrolase family 43 protein [Acidimicrobiales bacterium]|nr:glycoside hydrolase family 43 protein [Acidimicrobiales bacterium]